MDHENDEICLELGLGERTPKRDHSRKNKRVFLFDLSIPIHSSDRIISASSSSNLKILGEDEKEGSKNSFSSGSKEDDDNNFSKNFSRKKLKLTRDQTNLLEDSFRQHTTLNMAQKQALAEKLSLKPRQVEVWFQNRRARTKLKQTEVDCEFLRKKCERLSEENRTLKKELYEIRQSLKVEKPQAPPAAAARAPVPAPFFHRNPNSAAAHEKNGKDRGGGAKQELAAAAAVMEVVHES